MAIGMEVSDVRALALRSDVYFIDKITGAVLSAMPGKEKRLARLLGLLSDQIVDKLATKLEAAIVQAANHTRQGAAIAHLLRTYHDGSGQMVYKYSDAAAQALVSYSGGNTSTMTGVATKGAARVLKQIAKHGPGTKKRVWRGMVLANKPDGAIAEHDNYTGDARLTLKDIRRGAILTLDNHGISSWSTSEDAARFFADRPFEYDDLDPKTHTGIMFTAVGLLHGAPVAEHASSGFDEAEWLTSGAFRVISVEQIDGVTVVDMVHLPSERPGDAFETPALVIHLSGLTPTMKVEYMTPSWAPAGSLPAWWTEHGVEYAHRKTESTMFAFPSSETWRVLASALLGETLGFLQYGDPVTDHGSGRGATRQSYWNNVTDQIYAQIAGASRYRSGGITLSWGADGVLVSNTSRSDSQDEGFREWLRKHRFKFSRNLDAWFLPQSVGMIPPRVSIGALLKGLPSNYKQDVGLETAYADSATTNERRRAHIEMRADTADERAAKHSAVAGAAYARAHAIGEHIPMGQPILVDHHSAKRHMSDQSKISAAMSKHVEEHGIASSLASKADRLRAAADRVGRSTPEDRRRAERAAIKESGAIAVGDYIFSKYFHRDPGWVVSVGSKSATVIGESGGTWKVDLRYAEKKGDPPPFPVPGVLYKVGDVVDVRTLNWIGPFTITRLYYGGLSVGLDQKLSYYESKSVGWKAVRIHQPK